MGGIYLDGKMAPSLLEVCQRAVAGATGWSGWTTRARSSGGFPGAGPMGLVVHHTASPIRSTPGQQFNNDASYCAVGHEDAPVGNIVLGPEGQVSVHAAGAANTQGKGGPWTTSRGVVPLDGGNSRLIAVEASNDGQGQVWKPEQCEAYEGLAVEMAGAYGFQLNRWDTHASDILSHEEWTKPSCPGRKCDPAGPSPWSPKQSGGCSAGNLWSMDLFREAIAGTLPTTPTTPPEEDDVPFAAPLFIQANGEDGFYPGAVFATDGRYQTIKYMNQYAYGDARYWGAYLGRTEEEMAPQAVARVTSYGVLVNPEEYIRHTGIEPPS